MTTKINLDAVELVNGVTGVNVSGLDVQNDDGVFVLVDGSQWYLEVARGSEQGCVELLRAIKEMDVDQVVISGEGASIFLKEAEEMARACV